MTQTYTVYVPVTVEVAGGNITIGEMATIREILREEIRVFLDETDTPSDAVQDVLLFRELVKLGVEK